MNRAKQRRSRQARAGGDRDRETKRSAGRGRLEKEKRGEERKGIRGMRGYSYVVSATP
jgi:hypothetical protein